MPARLGGDEFAIIVPVLSSAAIAGRLAETIIEALQSGIEGAEDDAPIATSIGIAIFPDDATDRQGLLSHADVALYRAKNEGRGTASTPGGTACLLGSSHHPRSIRFVLKASERVPCLRGRLLHLIDDSCNLIP